MTKKNGKRSFVMYDSFWEAMKHLNDSEFRECVMKIRDYALEGIDEESQSPYVNIILAMAKPNLDSARRRYMASVENGKKGAEYGKFKGFFAKWNILHTFVLTKLLNNIVEL